MSYESQESAGDDPPLLDWDAIASDPAGELALDTREVIWFLRPGGARPHPEVDVSPPGTLRRLHAVIQHIELVESVDGELGRSDSTRLRDLLPFAPSVLKWLVELDRQHGYRDSWTADTDLGGHPFIRATFEDWLSDPDAGPFAGQRAAYVDACEQIVRDLNRAG